MRVSIRAFCVALAVLFSAAGQALADGPAVDGLNGKISLAAGAAEVRGINNSGSGTAVGAVEGILSAPIGNDLGVQVDALASIIGGHPGIGLGVHFFHRDPEVGLIGAIGQWAHLRGANLYRLGGEGEYYMGRWTTSLRAGWQFGTSARRGLFRAPEGGFARATLAYYPTDDLVFRAGIGIAPFSNSTYQGRISGLAEWQFNRRSLPGLTAFVDAVAGTRHSFIVTAGVRWHFRLSGDHDKSLIRRHREDDPGSLNNDILASGFTGQSDNPPQNQCPPGQAPFVPMAPGYVGDLQPGQCVPANMMIR